jgi:hypothetical protein
MTAFKPGASPPPVSIPIVPNMAKPTIIGPISPIGPINNTVYNFRLPIEK